MGGRGSSGGFNGNSVLGKPEPTKYHNERSRSSMNIWKRTNLEATVGSSPGQLVLDYPSNGVYSNPNQNTTYYDGKINHGFINTANGSMSGKWVGINWDNVKEVSGETYAIKDQLKKMGFKWNSQTKSWKKA